MARHVFENQKADNQTASGLPGVVLELGPAISFAKIESPRFSFHSRLRFLCGCCANKARVEYRTLASFFFHLAFPLAMT